MADGKYLVINPATGLIERIDAIATSNDSPDHLIKTDANGKIAESFMPAGIGSEIKNMPATETMSAPVIVNVFYDVDVVKARKADASMGGKQAVGYVITAVSSAGDTAEVRFDGIISGFSELTPGATYFLSEDTAGQITDTPPSTTGSYIQRIGVALSANQLLFEPKSPIKL